MPGEREDTATGPTDGTPDHVLLATARGRGRDRIWHEPMAAEGDGRLVPACSTVRPQLAQASFSTWRRDSLAGMWRKCPVCDGDPDAAYSSNGGGDQSLARALQSESVTTAAEALKRAQEVTNG